MCCTHNRVTKLSPFCIVQLYGKEKTTVRRHYNTGSTTSTQTLTGRHEFLKLYVMLGNSAGGRQRYEPGQYQFDFKFKLPDGLPPSFEVRGIDGNRGEVKYKLRVVGERTGLSRSLKATQDLIVQPSNALYQPKAIDSSAHTAINQCWCCASGEASIKASIEKDIVRGGERLPVGISAESSSTKAFKQIVVELRRRLVVSANDFGSSMYSTKSTRTLSKAQEPVRLAVGGQLKKSVLLDIPAQLPPTYLGKYIQCQYEIRCILKTSIFVKNLKVCLEVFSLPAPNATQQTVISSPQPAGATETADQQPQEEEAPSEQPASAPERVSAAAPVLLEDARWRPTKVYTIDDIQSTNMASPVWRR